MWEQRDEKMLWKVVERKSNGIQFAEFESRGEPAEMNGSETNFNDAHENRSLCIHEPC